MKRYKITNHFGNAFTIAIPDEWSLSPIKNGVVVLNENEEMQAMFQDVTILYSSDKITFDKEKGIPGEAK